MRENLTLERPRRRAGTTRLQPAAKPHGSGLKNNHSISIRTSSPAPFAFNRIRLSHPSGCYSIPIARVEHGFANIAQAENLRRQTLEADGQAAVRWHSELE